MIKHEETPKQILFPTFLRKKLFYVFVENVFVENVFVEHNGSSY